MADFAGKMRSYFATSSSTASSGAGRLWGYTATGDGTAATVTFLDGGSGGTTIWKDAIPASANASTSFSFPQGLDYGTDLYVTLSHVSNISVLIE
jgi:hypothetical protein